MSTPKFYGHKYPPMWAQGQTKGRHTQANHTSLFVNKEKENKPPAPRRNWAYPRSMLVSKHIFYLRFWIFLFYVLECFEYLKNAKVVTILNDFNHIYTFIHFFLLETSRRVAGRKLAFGQRVSKHPDDSVEGEGSLLQCLWQTTVTRFFTLWQEKGIVDFFKWNTLSEPSKK